MARKVGFREKVVMKGTVDPLTALVRALSDQKGKDHVFFSGDLIKYLISNNELDVKDSSLINLLERIGSVQGMNFWFDKRDLRGLLKCLS